MGLFRHWLVGRRARIMRGSPTAPNAAVGMLGAVQYYNPELHGELADRFRVWRLRGERDEELRHRLALAVQEEIIKLEAILDRLTKGR